MGKSWFLNRISRFMGLNIQGVFNGIGLPLPQAVPVSVGTANGNGVWVLRNQPALAASVLAACWWLWRSAPISTPATSPFSTFQCPATIT
jgi:hypothetical protein